MGARKRRQLFQRDTAYKEQKLLGEWVRLAHDENGGEGVEPSKLKGVGSQHHSAFGVQKRWASHDLS